MIWRCLINLLLPKAVMLLFFLAQILLILSLSKCILFENLCVVQWFTSFFVLLVFSVLNVRSSISNIRGFTFCRITDSLDKQGLQVSSSFLLFYSLVLIISLCFQLSFFVTITEFIFLEIIAGTTTLLQASAPLIYILALVSEHGPNSSVASKVSSCRY